MIYLIDGIPFSESGLLQYIRDNGETPMKNKPIVVWEFNEETDDWERPE